MTETVLFDLMQRAREDSATSEDAMAAAALLPSLVNPVNRYDALFVIGKGGFVEHQDLVASFLESPDDPMLSRLAIQILCDWWGLGEQYARQLQAFIAGVSWDLEDGGYVRSVAVSAAGAALRDSEDPALMAELLRTFDAAQESDTIRSQAYTALLRAAGKEWRDVLAVPRDAWQRAPDRAVLDSLRKRA